MNHQLVFYTQVGWDDFYDRPAFGVRPINEVANYYETTTEDIIKAFKAWVENGMPKIFDYVIDSFLTLKRQEKRNIYLRIHYDPSVFYCDGSISQYIQWGNGDDKRAGNLRFTTFSLEPILSIVTHEERSTK